MGPRRIDDREAFAALFQTHYALVHAFAARRVGRDLADEVVAETFLVAWRRLEAVPDEPLPWLYGVARNVVLRQHRAFARQEATRDVLAREPRLRWTDEEAVHDGLWRAWGLLSASDREVLALIAWEDLTVADAARVLGVPSSVFSVRLHRARRRLERHLQSPTTTALSATPEAR
jgi:RNA polymerase sigma-70 factor (ECF subfamily)